MSKYFEVDNDNSKVVLDDTFARVCITKKGKLSDLKATTIFNGNVYANNNLINTIVALDVPISSQRENIAIKPQVLSDYTGYAVQRLKNKLRLMVIYTNNQSKVPLSAVDYIIVDGDNGKSSGINYGLQVFNESGTMIFDSGKTYLNVVSTFSYTPAVGSMDQGCIMDKGMESCALIEEKGGSIKYRNCFPTAKVTVPSAPSNYYYLVNSTACYVALLGVVNNALPLAGIRYCGIFIGSKSVTIKSPCYFWYQFGEEDFVAIKQFSTSFVTQGLVISANNIL